MQNNVLSEFLHAAKYLAAKKNPNDDDEEVNAEYHVWLLFILLKRELQGLFVEQALLQILAALYGATSYVVTVHDEIDFWIFRNCRSIPCPEKCGDCCECEQVIFETQMVVSEYESFNDKYDLMYEHAYGCAGRYSCPPGMCEGTAPPEYLFCKSCVENKSGVPRVQLMDPNTFEYIGSVPLDGRNVLRPQTPWFPAVLPAAKLPLCEPKD